MCVCCPVSNTEWKIFENVWRNYIARKKKNNPETYREWMRTRICSFTNRWGGEMGILLCQVLSGDKKSIHLIPVRRFSCIRINTSYILQWFCRSFSSLDWIGMFQSSFWTGWLQLIIIIPHWLKSSYLGGAIANIWLIKKALTDSAASIHSSVPSGRKDS